MVMSPTALSWFSSSFEPAKRPRASVCASKRDGRMSPLMAYFELSSMMIVASSTMVFF